MCCVIVYLLVRSFIFQYREYVSTGYGTYYKVLGTGKSCLLYQVFCDISNLSNIKPMKPFHCKIVATFNEHNYTKRVQNHNYVQGCRFADLGCKSGVAIGVQNLPFFWVCRLVWLWHIEILFILYCSIR